MENNATTGAVAQEAPPMSFFERLIGVYFEPSKTFADISRKRSWFGIFLLFCIVNLAAGYALQWRMDPADAALKGMAMSKPFLKKFLSPEAIAQQEELVQKQALQPRSFLRKYSGLLVAPVMIYLSYLLMAAILLLAFIITGAGITFRKSFTTTIWATAPPAIVVTLLSLLFIFLKNPADLEIAPVYNVMSNLGMLANFNTNPALNSFLSSIDLFSIWTVILLSIGFAAMSEKKLTPAKAAVPIVCLWVVWVLVKVGFWSLLG